MSALPFIKIGRSAGLTVTSNLHSPPLLFCSYKAVVVQVIYVTPSTSADQSSFVKRNILICCRSHHTDTILVKTHRKTNRFAAVTLFRYGNVPNVLNNLALFHQTQFATRSSLQLSPYSTKHVI